MLIVNGLKVKVGGTDETIAADLVMLMKLVQQTHPAAFHTAILTLYEAEKRDYPIRFKREDDDGAAD